MLSNKQNHSTAVNKVSHNETGHLVVAERKEAIGNLASSAVVILTPRALTARLKGRRATNVTEVTTLQICVTLLLLRMGSLLVKPLLLLQNRIAVEAFGCYTSVHLVVPQKSK